jgi:hypothetical protein
MTQTISNNMTNDQDYDLKPYLKRTGKQLPKIRINHTEDLNETVTKYLRGLVPTKVRQPWLCGQS